MIYSDDAFSNSQRQKDPPGVPIFPPRHGDILPDERRTPTSNVSLRMKLLEKGIMLNAIIGLERGVAPYHSYHRYLLGRILSIRKERTETLIIQLLCQLLNFTVVRIRQEAVQHIVSRGLSASAVIDTDES